MDTDTDKKLSRYDLFKSEFKISMSKCEISYGKTLQHCGDYRWQEPDMEKKMKANEQAILMKHLGYHHSNIANAYTVRNTVVREFGPDCQKDPEYIEMDEYFMRHIVFLPQKLLDTVMFEVKREMYRPVIPLYKAATF